MFNPYELDMMASSQEADKICERLARIAGRGYKWHDALMSATEGDLEVLDVLFSEDRRRVENFRRLFD